MFVTKLKRDALVCRLTQENISKFITCRESMKTQYVSTFCRTKSVGQVSTLFLID